MLAGAGCSSDSAGSPFDAGRHDGGGGHGGAGGAGGGVSVTPLVVAAGSPTPRTTSWSVNYWMWAPSFGNDVAGTEAAVAALKPTFMRVGGYNNDANVPDPFDHAQLDAMVAYARAIGAEPILQVPVLGDIDGSQPTPATAAEMVTYANVTKGYGIKYFSVGNEPDIYADQASATAPSRPGYTAADTCTTITAFVAAMKGVDPTIKIVGPDLAYKYQAGNGMYDWLTPILQTCGNLLDVVSIHRYPFEAAMATLPAAAADRTAFRQVISSVRGIMQATGQGGKPLALTEMNVAYDATSCVLDASPATVGGAMWLADAVGSAIQLGLWTSAVWDISDDESYALGLIDHNGLARPAYYAYQVFADHFGPNLAGVSSAPSGVSAYASRNAANDATDIIYVNWNTADVGVQVQVTGLATAPAAPTFRLPAESFGAIEVPDTGDATAWTYGEAERKVAAGPHPLVAGTGPPATLDAGVPAQSAGHAVGMNCADGGPFVCPTTTLTSNAITTAGKAGSTGVAFGSGSNAWGSYSYAAPGQTGPVGTVTSDGNGFRIQAGFVPPVTSASNYMGFGLYYSGSDCLDASARTGIQFEFSGSLGACLLGVSAGFSGDVSHQDDTVRGGCAGASGTCYGPTADVTAQATQAADGGVTVKVPFSAMTGGMPLNAADPRTLINVQWQLSTALGTSDGGGCSADFTVENAAFY